VYPGRSGLNEGPFAPAPEGKRVRTMRTVFTIYVVVIAAGIVAAVLVAVTET
jgi:hypothetical protein